MSLRDEEQYTKPPLHTRQSAQSLLLPTLQLPGRISPTLAADPTTAVTLENVDQAELAYFDSARENLDQRGSSRVSVASNVTVDPDPSSGDEENTLEAEESTLANMLHGLMVKDLRRAANRSVASLADFSIFSDDYGGFNEQYVAQKIVFDKTCGNGDFQEKLKQFFILSTAGKPIYSMNGSEDVVLGYMGLLTTIILTFQESMKTEFHHVSQGGLRIVALTKAPLILVSISKVVLEQIPSTGALTSAVLLENQLLALYNYLLAVLSKPVIAKNFEKGMNYDLRRILSPQDMHVLDTLSMGLTYGFTTTDTGKYWLQGLQYVGSILGNALACAKITNSCRSKLNYIVLQAKKLKVKDDASDVKSVLLNRFMDTERERYLASDLLFSFLLLEDKIINYMKPRNHDLTNEDIRTLLSTISASYKAIEQEESADLWIPLCMPNFNSSGFLYLYVKKFSVAECTKPVTIALLSSNKNSFFDMKEVAGYIMHRIGRSEALKAKLGRDLVLAGSMASIFHQLGISVIKHFIFKYKPYNQFYMGDIFGSAETDDISVLRAHCQVLYFYSALASSKATIVKQGDANPKKLTYTRWQLNDEWVTGFMLADEKFEFYCLCGGVVQAQHIIDQSLQLIKWCERYKKRLFFAGGVTF